MRVHSVVGICSWALSRANSRKRDHTTVTARRSLRIASGGLRRHESHNIQTPYVSVR